MRIPSMYCLNMYMNTCILRSVEWLVLDEADKLFEDGANDSGFREQVCVCIE